MRRLLTLLSVVVVAAGVLSADVASARDHFDGDHHGNLRIDHPNAWHADPGACRHRPHVQPVYVVPQPYYPAYQYPYYYYQRPVYYGPVFVPAGAMFGPQAVQRFMGVR